MKVRPVSSWKSSFPDRLRGKSANYFCLFRKVKSAAYGPGNAPVFLNVYDLTPANDYVYWSGLGIFHSGVEVYGVEYTFGAHDYPSSGVFEVEPRNCPGFKFRKSMLVGTTSLDPIQVRDFMERQSANYHGNSYHLLVKNCNHFSQDMCFKLTGKTIPRWVNRLARIGSMCNCILPVGLKVPAACHDPKYRAHKSERKGLRNSAFTYFPSMSLHEKEVSISSLFLHSLYKGCLPPWEMKRSKSRRSLLKEGAYYYFASCRRGLGEQIWMQLFDSILKLHTPLSLSLIYFIHVNESCKLFVRVRETDDYTSDCSPILT